MKKLFLFGLLGMTFLAGEVNAQLQKGTKYQGATINLNGQHTKPTEGSATIRFGQFAVNPSVQIGKFVKDNRMLGVGLSTSLNFAWDKSPTNSGNFITRYYQGYHGLSFFLRQYKPLGPKWAIFLHSAVEGQWLTSRTRVFEENVRDKGYSVGISVLPGVAFWFSPRFAIESDINLLSLGVNYSDFRDIDTFQFQSSVTTGIGSYFGVRASWYLQKP